MRRTTLLILSLLLCTAASAQFRSPRYGELDESEAASTMRRDVAFLSAAALEGRAAGSEGEKEAAAYLSERLASYGVDVLSGKEGEVFGMKRGEGDTLVSRNVVAFIPGYDKALKDHYILIGAHLDGTGMRKIVRDGAVQEVCIPGANANASGLAILVQLARMLQTNSVLLRRSVLLVGFGAGARQHAGAWYFLNRSFPDAGNIDAMVNLDILGCPSGGFSAFSGSNADLDRIGEALRETLQPIRPATVALEPFPSDHRAFYDKRIPSVLFTTGLFPERDTPRDNASILEYDGMERMLEYIYNYTLMLTGGPAPLFDPAERLKTGDGGSDRPIPYYECDWKPSFLGSTDPKVFLQKWVYVYLRYPEECVRKGIQGRVQVDFVIDRKGKVRDVRVLKGVHPLLDSEAVRVIEASPDWKPARLRGKKVNSGMTLYVEFRLEKKNKK